MTRYKPGTLLKSISSDERLWYGDKENTTNGTNWHKIPKNLVVMVLSTPQIRDTEAPGYYYYELLVSDKHAQNHKSEIENPCRWEAIENGKDK